MPSPPIPFMLLLAGVAVEARAQQCLVESETYVQMVPASCPVDDSFITAELGLDSIHSTNGRTWNKHSCLGYVGVNGVCRSHVFWEDVGGSNALQTASPPQVHYSPKDRSSDTFALSAHLGAYADERQRREQAEAEQALLNFIAQRQAQSSAGQSPASLPGFSAPPTSRSIGGEFVEYTSRDPEDIALFKEGLLHFRNRADPVSKNRAFQVFSGLCKDTVSGGHSTSCKMASLLCQDGASACVSPAQTEGLLQRGCDLGDGQSCLMIVDRALDEGNLDRASRYLDIACFMGEFTACVANPD